jgi:hypothetical protein
LLRRKTLKTTDKYFETSNTERLELYSSRIILVQNSYYNIDVDWGGIFPCLPLHKGAVDVSLICLDFAPELYYIPGQMIINR